MKRKHILILLVALAAATAALADKGSVQIRGGVAQPVLRVDGDRDEDWQIQTSTNLSQWTTLTNFGTIISGNATNAPWRTAPASAAPAQYYRALKTEGLFDHRLFRTVNLVFTQANWGTLLASGRTYETNTACTLFLDNGATNLAVGARYKGNTSYTTSGAKKSINLELDWKDTNADLMTYQTINLNNAAADETIMREALYFNVMSQYTPCPQGAMARVFINGSLWGVYSLVEQENTQLIKEWFTSAQGDRWRTPNAPMGGGGGPGQGFIGSNSAFAYYGPNVSTYTNAYILKTDNTAPTNAWARLINAIRILNATPTNQLRSEAESVLAVDGWLWFLAIENIFADDDSYWNKGADYSFYYEPESGRIHPVEHDGNEAFQAGDSALSPLTGATGTNRPLLYRLLPINELRQRYLAHMRTVLQEYYNPVVMTPMINAYHELSINAIIADPNKGFTMAAYTNDLVALRTYVTNRYNYLRAHAEVSQVGPVIAAVNGPAAPPSPTEIPIVTAEVQGGGGYGVESVWLYFRDKPYGLFTAVQMFDDGAHGDGAAGDAIFGAATTNYPAGNKIHYYVEARSANASKTATFSPARAERVTHSYRVSLTTATNTPVVINEFMASNTATLADPQGEFDDWIELRNLTGSPVDLTGRYLSDDATNPRKWSFPPGTTVPADSYLLVWADEDGLATAGLHANFKLASTGEQILLIDTDANLNAVLDTITFGAQQTDRSFGRSGPDADVWVEMTPTPGTENR